MSTLSLPSYVGAPLDPAPSYAPRNAVLDTFLPSGSFIKESKGGGVVFRLGAQADNVELPVYGTGSSVEGTIELSKTDAVESVEVKIHGRLVLKEIAGSGTSYANLCLNSTLLWFKHTSDAQCPGSHPFSLALPKTFDYEGVTYALPPSFNVKLSGVPGFIATIEYAVAAIVAKSLPVPMPHLTAKALGIHFGTTIVSTPFIYYPRSRPPRPLPAPLQISQTAYEPFKPGNEWELHEFTLRSRDMFKPDIATKLYLPSSRAFSITQPIPFYLTVESTTSASLAAFLPFSPTGNAFFARKVTRLQLMRQSTVDARHAVLRLTKGEMWRTDCIGEGTFNHVGDGPSWMSYTGQIVIDSKVKVGGFKAAGLSVKDCLVFSITPQEVSKAAFNELREVIPVRLTTD